MVHQAEEMNDEVTWDRGITSQVLNQYLRISHQGLKEKGFSCKPSFGLRDALSVPEDEFGM